MRPYCISGSFRRTAALACVAAILMAASLPAAANLRKLTADLARAVATENSDRVKSLIDEITAIGTSASAEELLKVVLKQPDMNSELYEFFLDGLAALDSDACQEYYAKEMDAKRPPAVRVLLVDVASRMKGDRGIGIIVAGVKDDAINVVEAALEAVLQRRPKAAVPALIERLVFWHGRKVKDAVYYNLRHTLIMLTGENMASPDDWEKWWEANSATFDPAKIEQTGRTARRVLGADDDPSFFGVPVSSRNVVFVIDISGSMMYVMKDDIPGLGTADGSDAAGGFRPPKEKITPENERLARYWTRIEMAKRNLIKVLLGLQAPTRFNIVTFHSRVQQLQKRSQAVSPATQKAAAQWVRNQKHQGETATLAAFKAAFQSDPGLNTIYFLSDGLPSLDGKTIDDLDEVLAEILKLNRFRKIRIHTFGFDSRTMAGQLNPELERANAFLRQIAAKSGGTFTAMKVDPNEKPPDDFR